MTNLERDLDTALGSLLRRMDFIEIQKNQLFELLNGIEKYKKILRKMEKNQIITKKEHEEIEQFIKIWGISTIVFNLLGNRQLISENEHRQDSISIVRFIATYPLVVDADEVREDIWSLLGDWIAEIRKNWKWGLVKKDKLSWWEDVIRFLFNLGWSQPWVLTFSKEEYDKYGLIEVRNYLYWNGNQSYYNTMFLKKIEELENWNFYFLDLWKYSMLQIFDRDNIWFSTFWWWHYKIIHKDISAEWIKIYEIWTPFKSNWDIVRKWFDAFNTFEAEIKNIGKVIFKKKYDTSGNLLWIYTFKKKRFGWEEHIATRDKGY